MRPRFLERLLLTLVKLGAEFSTAAYLMVTYIPASALGLELSPSFGDAVSRTLLYGAVFGYIPVALLMAILWGGLPRNWRPKFNLGLLLLGLAFAAAALVILTPASPISPIYYGMGLMGVVVWFVWSILLGARPDP